MQLQRQKNKRNRKFDEPPLKVKLVRMLGIEQFLINKYVFNRPQKRYKFQNFFNKKELLVQQVNIFIPPLNYTYKVDIVNGQNYSIPFALLQNKNKKNKDLVIYSHGNSTDLSEAIMYISKLADVSKSQLDFLTYDYTGYGISTIKQTTEEQISKDLQTILTKYIDYEIQNVILMGFSLGCFPSIKVASKYKVKGLILVSPLLSLISVLEQKQKCHPQKLYENDKFETIDHIHKVQSHILIIHSTDDEIIPYQHSKILYQTYCKYSANQFIQFESFDQLKHNETNNKIISSKSNKIQQKVVRFINYLPKIQSVEKQIQKRRQKERRFNSSLNQGQEIFLQTKRIRNKEDNRQRLMKNIKVEGNAENLINHSNFCC